MWRCVVVNWQPSVKFAPKNYDALLYFFVGWYVCIQFTMIHYAVLPGNNILSY